MSRVAAASRWIAGVDEAGRGPLAGPVVAAAVVLPPGGIAGIVDSKCLAPRRRGAVFARIRGEALAWSVGRAEVEEIDLYNILQASLLAMRRAVAALEPKPQRVLVDGAQCPRFDCPGEAIVGGDAAVAAIGAASIVAKETRDAEMVDLDAVFPGYGFARHKGYGTREHLAALRRLGPTPSHRRSFAPVRRLIVDL